MQTSKYKISNWLIGGEEFIKTVDQTSFTILLDKFINNPDFKYVHALLGYPSIWPKDLDLLSFVNPRYLLEIKNKKCYFVFDCSCEGFSPFNVEFPFFDMLYHSCSVHDIDPSMIIHVSSNLKDEENMQKYCAANNKKPFNVFVFPAFEMILNTSVTDEENQKLFRRCQTATKEKFADKYFSSLSRVNRFRRTAATFMLCQHDIKKHALISHNKFDQNVNRFDLQFWIQRLGYTNGDLEKFISSLPLIVDYTDFDTNWAGTPYSHIHDQTLFQIVNETMTDDFGFNHQCNHGTSLFYSEKTFRPMTQYMPFIIFGQAGCNRYLKNLGYRTYEEWFDLSFDDEPDWWHRYRKILETVADTCKYLDSLTRDQKIEWKFKNQEILLHNYRTVSVKQYSNDKMKQFVSQLL